MTSFAKHFGRTIGAIVLVAALTSALPASAETVEVAPGVQVTKRSYKAPTNEQPFFGFAEKNAEEKAGDEKFVNAIVAATGTREKAFEEITKRAWRALNTGKIHEAAVRFNQAYLISPEESAVYHGFAVVAQFRFNDFDASDELFKIALKQRDPVKALRADYGRMLLIAKRPRDAEPVLEQAVKDAPDFGDAWTNLAVARFQNGNAPAACAAVEEALKRRPSNNSGQDLITVKNAAQCK
jgi:predicted Zn-dependent protease